MATKSDQYLLDLSVATLILDGELWDREPYKLLGHRKELRLQLEQCGVFKVMSCEHFVQDFWRILIIITPKPIVQPRMRWMIAIFVQTPHFP